MSRNTVRALLLSSASALTLLSFGAQAQTVQLNGGGASLPSQDYAGPLVVNNATPTSPSEEYVFNSANSQYGFQYFYASSGRGQAAFSGDNPASFQYTGTTSLPPSVEYAGSDAFLAYNASQPLPQTINGYTYNNGIKTESGKTIPGVSVDYTFNGSISGSRLATDGALIQLPMLGVGIAFPALSGNPAVKNNGVLHLDDNDLCGIFSGKITSYGGIDHPLKGVSGAIRVYYRGDSSGTSFLFTNHLHAVCNSSNSSFPAAGLAAVPSTTFTAIFTGGAVPSNFTPETGSAALATALAGTVTTSGGTTVGQPGDPTGIGYLSTDFTNISANGKKNDIAAPNPPGGFINTRALFDASVQGKNAAGAIAFLTPSVANLNLAFGHPGTGSTHGTPPSGNAAINPLNWIPSIPTTNEGYPVVGFTTWELAQCYHDPNVASGLSSFLDDRFTGQAAYLDVIKSNGFTLPSKPYRTAIISTFLTASSPLAIAAAGTAGTCAHVAGR